MRGIFAHATVSLSVVLPADATTSPVALSDSLRTLVAHLNARRDRVGRTFTYEVLVPVNPSGESGGALLDAARAVPGVRCVVDDSAAAQFAFGHLTRLGVLQAAGAHVLLLGPAAARGPETVVTRLLTGVPSLESALGDVVGRQGVANYAAAGGAGQLPTGRPSPVPASSEPTTPPRTPGLVGDWLLAEDTYGAAIARIPPSGAAAARVPSPGHSSQGEGGVRGGHAH